MDDALVMVCFFIRSYTCQVCRVIIQISYFQAQLITGYIASSLQGLPAINVAKWLCLQIRLS